MTPDEIDEFIDLMREYRTRGRLDKADRERFRELASLYREMQIQPHPAGRSER